MPPAQLSGRHTCLITHRHASVPLGYLIAASLVAAPVSSGCRSPSPFVVHETMHRAAHERTAQACEGT
jgi:hypothetical protein